MFSVAALFVFLLLFLVPQEARAALFSLTDIASSAIIGSLEIISAIILAIVGALIKIASLLVVFALWLDKFIISPDSEGFIVQGWVIFRDLANLGFVLGIVIIAIATILRYKNYSAQSLLFKLVAAALLVNFSLVIAIPFVQLSDSFSRYFLQSIAGGGTTSSDDNSMFSQAALKIAAAMDMSDIIKNINNSSGQAGGVDQSIGNQSVTATMVDTIIGAVFAVIVGAMVALTLLGLGVVLFIRFFYLAILLMISPVVWLLWIFPSTSKHFSHWWEKFIHWNLFAPTILFFLSLAMGLSSSQMMAQVGSETGEISGGTQFGGLLLNDIMTPLIVIALILAGMVAASKLGVEGGNIATGAAGKVVNYTKGKAKEYGARGATKVGSSLAQSKLGQATQNKLSAWGSTRLGKVTGMGYLAQQQARATTKLQQAASAPMDQAKKRVDEMTNDQLIAHWGTLDKYQKAIALQRLQGAGLHGRLLATNAGAQNDVDSSLSLLRGMGKEREADALAASFAGLEDVAMRDRIFGKMTNDRDRAEMTKQLAAEGKLERAIDANVVQIGSLTKTLNLLRSNGRGKEADAILQSIAGNKAVADVGFSSFTHRDQAVIIQTLSASGKAGKLAGNATRENLRIAADDLKARGMSKEASEMLLANGFTEKMLDPSFDRDFENEFNKAQNEMTPDQRVTFVRNTADMVHKGQFFGGPAGAPDIVKERMYNDAMSDNAMVRHMVVAGARGTTGKMIKQGLIDKKLEVLKAEAEEARKDLKSFETEYGEKYTKKGIPPPKSEELRLDKRKAEVDDLEKEYLKYSSFATAGDYDGLIKAMRAGRGPLQEFARSVGKIS